MLEGDFETEYLKTEVLAPDFPAAVWSVSLRLLRQ